MKNKFAMLFMILGLITIGLYSCADQGELEAQMETEVTDEIQSKRKLYQACWDEWGRASKDCKGGGLCNFRDCWAWQEPCCPRAAPILEDEVAGVFYIHIELSSKYEQEAEFIKTRSPLYVDVDIVEDAIDPDWSTLTVKAAAYPFDATIGAEGGFKVPLVIN